MNLAEQTTDNETYDQLKAAFVTTVYNRFSQSKDEISERNAYVEERDNYIYGDYLRKSLKIPTGHDFTPANWLRRAVEIHKNTFMGRGFTVSSSYDTNDLSTASDDEDRKRKEIENQKQKQFAEARMQAIKAIKEDNGGDAMWAALAENAGAVGHSALVQYWNSDEQKVEQCQIESIENLFVLWETADFRKPAAFAYAFQVQKADAISEYGAAENVPTAPAGDPMNPINGGTTSPQGSPVSNPMVTIVEVTGILEGWAGDKNMLKRVKPGKETPINVKIVGNEIQKVVTEEKKQPKYYLLPNKLVRRRPWGVSDITDEAIQILLTYIETYSDWRTVASKTNFPKYKALGFSDATNMPKYEKRKIQLLPLSEGQDLVELDQSDSNGLDWGRQLEEAEKLFIREVSVASVLFNDPTITLNSNQALTTSMKPTTDVAEAKKQLWQPVIQQIYSDALELAAHFMPEQYGDLVAEGDSWTLKIMWPSIMEKDDPTYQTQLLNRFNAGLMSAQTYMESQGESKEEIDRIREELTDPVTAGILSHQTPLIAQALINAATAEIQAWFTMMQPATQQAQQSLDQGAAGIPGGTATPGVNPNGGGSAPAQVGVTNGNQPGQSPMSQPGSGASATSVGGALAQSQQNSGQ
jgi:hypothetical protein